MRCIGCRACFETRPACVGSLLGMRYVADSIKKNTLILRRLAKRGLEGRTTFLQPCGILAQPLRSTHPTPH
jgi:hypothetical protein